jgi:uncharacterized coiled-coil DUF342 family protein
MRNGFGGFYHMKTKSLAKAKKDIEKQITKLSKDRDELRNLLEEWQETLTDCDEAIELLEQSVETLSQTV